MLLQSFKILTLSIVTLFVIQTAQSQSTVKWETVHSEALGISKAYKIYLPDGYDQSDERYPVVYFLRNHESEWFEKSYFGRSGKALKEVADRLIENGLIGKMILVAPNTGSANGNYAGCCVNALRPDLASEAGMGTGKFEDFLIHDLISAIDSTYRTIPDQAHRGVEGFSLGGFASTCLSLRNPTVFASVGAFDGTLMYKNLEDPNTSDGLDVYWHNYAPENADVDVLFDNPRNEAYMREHSVCDILDQSDPASLELIRGMRFHISSSFREFVGNYWRNTQFVNALKRHNIRNSFGNRRIHAEAAHDWGFADEHASASLIKHWQTFNGTKISAPSLINFSITEETGKDYEVVVFNYSPDELTIHSIYSGSPAFTIDDVPVLPRTLAPLSDTLSFSISFDPPAYAAYTDTIYITSDDSVTPTAKIIVKGKGGSYRAEAGLIYAVSAKDKLYTINPAALTVHETGPFGRGWSQIRTITVSQHSRELMGLKSWNYGWQEILRINTHGADVYSYANWESVAGIKDISCGTDSLLYMADGSGNIYNVDLASDYWPPSILKSAQVPLYLTSMVCNPLTGEFWLAAQIPRTTEYDYIFKIDVTTGDTTCVGRTGFNETVRSLAFDHQGHLYGLLGTYSNALISIDTATGIADTVLDLGSLALTSLAISPEEPTGFRTGEPIQAVTHSALLQNYPNPFNPTTTIEFTLPKSEFVELKVYNLLGKEVAKLVSANLRQGNHTYTFDGRKLASGVYYYQLVAGDPSTGSGQRYREVKKMILIR